MFDSGYENCPEFRVLGGVIFKLDILQTGRKNYCSSGAFQVAPASYYVIVEDYLDQSYSNKPNMSS